MKDEQFNRLLERAKSDTSFLHTLVFESKKAVDELAYLDEAARDNILKISPENTLRGIITGGGTLADCTVTVNCGSTCTHTSSLEELQGRVGNPLADCGVTVQCTATCGHTSSMPALREGLQESIASKVHQQMRQ